MEKCSPCTEAVLKEACNHMLRCLNIYNCTSWMHPICGEEHCVTSLKTTVQETVGKAALILNFFSPMATSCFSQLMILLEDDLPGPFPIGQVSFNSYLSSKNLLVPDYLTGLFLKPWVSLEGNCCAVIVGQWSTHLVLLAKLLIKVIRSFECQPAL